MIQDPQLQQMVIDIRLTTIKDPNPKIRAKSTQALGEIGPTTVIFQLPTNLYPGRQTNHLALMLRFVKAELS